LNYNTYIIKLAIIFLQLPIIWISVGSDTTDILQQRFYVEANPRLLTLRNSSFILFLRFLCTVWHNAQRYQLSDQKSEIVTAFWQKKVIKKKISFFLEWRFCLSFIHTFFVKLFTIPHKFSIIHQKGKWWKWVE